MKKRVLRPIIVSPLRATNAERSQQTDKLFLASLQKVEEHNKRMERGQAEVSNFDTIISQLKNNPKRPEPITDPLHRIDITDELTARMPAVTVPQRATEDVEPTIAVKCTDYRMTAYTRPYVALIAIAVQHMELHGSKPYAVLLHPADVPRIAQATQSVEGQANGSFLFGGNRIALLTKHHMPAWLRDIIPTLTPGVLISLG